MAEAQKASLPQKSAPAKSGETVTVACKLPAGLILQTHTFHKEMQEMIGGRSREISVAQPDEQSFTLNGWARKKGEDRPYLIIGGYAITEGVPKDLWDKWLDEYKDTKFVTEHLIYAMPTTHGATDRALEQKSVKSGLEPIDPNNMPPGFRPIKKAESPNQAA